MRNRIAVVLVVFSFLFTPVFALAQHEQHQGQGKPATGSETSPSPSGDVARHDPGSMGGMQHGMMGKCMEEKKAKREKVMADLKELDAKLDEKLSAMNAAKGDKKVEAMATVISELIAQRKEINEKLLSVQECPMMQHGGMKQMKGCPMMQQHMQGDKKGNNPSQ